MAICTVLLGAVLAEGEETGSSKLAGFEHVGKNEKGYHEYEHQRTGIVMVLLPEGEFEMGSTEAEERWFVSSVVGVLGERFRKQAEDRAESEQPRHTVELSGFLIAKYEVSQKEWTRIMGVNPSRFRGEGLPVDSVSWEDCVRFCDKTGLSLPSEAQWEYACRAGTKGPFCFGDKLAGECANFESRKTVPVNSFESNGFGLFNVHGNVLEWCLDSFDAEYYKQDESGGPNPVCKKAGRKVTRGGGFGSVMVACRSAARHSFSASRAGSVHGFRPAVSVKSIARDEKVGKEGN